MEVAWLNYLHDYFRNQPGKAAQRQKALLLDLFEMASPVPISEVDQISSRLAKAYAGMHPRTPARNVETVHEEGLLIEQGQSVRANQRTHCGLLASESGTALAIFCASPSCFRRLLRYQFPFPR